MDEHEPTSAPTAVDARAQSRVEQGDLAGAATEVVGAYGPELLGWLRAVAQTEAEGDDAFSVVCERLWKALPQLDWTRPVRTWLYVVGRNVLRDERRRQRVRGAVPISQAPELAAIVRSTTAAFRQTGQHDRLAKLRSELAPDERMLLILRIDRDLPWRDIAEILGGGEASPQELDRVAARARKRFARLKDRLRASWAASS